MLEWQKNLLGRSTIITFDIWWGGGIGICGGVNPSFWSFNGIDDLMISISSIILCHYFVNKEQIKWLPTEPINWIILLCWVAKVHFIKKVNSFGILSNWSEFVRIKLKKKIWCNSCWFTTTHLSTCRLFTFLKRKTLLPLFYVSALFCWPTDLTEIFLSGWCEIWEVNQRKYFEPMCPCLWGIFVNPALIMRKHLLMASLAKVYLGSMSWLESASCPLSEKR